MDKLIKFAEKEVEGIISHLPDDDKEILEAYIASRESKSKKEGQTETEVGGCVAGVFVVALVIVLGFIFYGWVTTSNMEAVLQAQYRINVEKHIVQERTMSNQIKSLEHRCIEQVVCECLKEKVSK